MSKHNLAEMQICLYRHANYCLIWKVLGNKRLEETVLNKCHERPHLLYVNIQVVFSEFQEQLQ